MKIPAVFKRRLRLSQFWLLVLLFVMTAECVQAQFTFSTNNGAITITGYTGSSSVVVIPNQTNGWPVTTIATSAFFNRLGITALTLPSTITNIGVSAFTGCSFPSLTLPDGLLTIGGSAFQSCGLTNIAIPNSVTILGSSVFQSCRYLRSVNLSTNVTKIPSQVFGTCSALTGITIPNGVTDIGHSAFHFSGLTNVFIPASVTNIGDGMAAFDGCNSLTNVGVDPLNPFYWSVGGVLFNKSQTRLLQFPGAKPGPYSIPADVTEIGYAAFQGCSGLTVIAIPENVTALGVYAFHSCGNLSSILIGRGVSRLGGNHEFVGCFSLTNIAVDPWNAFFSSVDGVLFDKTGSSLIAYPGGKKGGYIAPASLTTIVDGAFDLCTNVTSITLPNSCTTIGRGAFDGCFGLANVALGNGVRNIGDFAFASCRKLATITIPATVTNISTRAFVWNSALTAVLFQGNAPAVASDAFQGCPATIYYLPGTAGWGPTLAGLPTKPWFLPSPIILSSSSSGSGIGTNGFGFRISWATNVSVAIEACDDLITADWSPLLTNFLIGGVSDFNDRSWTNYGRRFYQIRSP